MYISVEYALSEEPAFAQRKVFVESLISCISISWVGKALTEHEKKQGMTDIVLNVAETGDIFSIKFISPR